MYTVNQWIGFYMIGNSAMKVNPLNFADLPMLPFENLDYDSLAEGIIHLLRLQNFPKN